MRTGSGSQGSRPIDAEEQPGAPDEFGLIADAAPVPMWVTRLDRKRAFVNKAYAAFLGVSYAEALEFDWRTRLHPEDAARIAAESVAGEASLQTFTLEARYRNGAGAWRWLRSVSQPRWDAAGAHIGFIGVAHDVTEAKEAIAAAEERQTQLFAYIDQATVGFAQVDLDGRFTLVNSRFCEITGRAEADLLETTMQAITHPDDLPANLPLFERAVAAGTPYRHEKRYLRPDGSHVWVNNSVAVIRRPDGSPYGVLAVTVDITEQRRAQTRQRLLIDELNHRVKNMLAVVQGMAQQTLRAGADPAVAREAFEGRLNALATAHGLLTDESWEPVRARTVLRDALAPHASEAITLDGPDFAVPARTAVTLALAAHELATNAVKHGALSVPEGRVRVHWTLDETLRLEWRESGGPPVSPPARRGFGTRMIERALASDLGGTAAIEFASGGIVCRVEAPAPKVRA